MLFYKKKTEEEVLIPLCFNVKALYQFSKESLKIPYFGIEGSFILFFFILLLVTNRKEKFCLDQIFNHLHQNPVLIEQHL